MSALFGTRFAAEHDVTNPFGDIGVCPQVTYIPIQSTADDDAQSRKENPCSSVRFWRP